MKQSLNFKALLIFLTWMAELTAAEPTKSITAEDRRHWSFVPTVRTDIPKLKNMGWCRNSIDVLILASLREVELNPTEEATRPALLRRLSFDLTGLPPTPAEVEAFLQDARPDAYERLVDRLLASPRYGERWAQHWLDLARYADTDGFEFDQVRPNAWRYRDWVVSALNADVPYDTFLRLQLAGDEVAPGDPDATIATGFNRCYPDMVDLNDQGLRRQNALNDITETTGLVFLGLTFGCARCHDHKADPISQVDYFRLQAFFAPARFRDDLPIAAPAACAEFAARHAAWERRINEVYHVLLAIEEPVRRVLTPGAPANADDDTAAAFAKSANERNARDERLLVDAWMKDRRIEAAAWAKQLDPETAARRGALLSRLDPLKAEEPKLPQART